MYQLGQDEKNKTKKKQKKKNIYTHKKVYIFARNSEKCNEHKRSDCIYFLFTYLAFVLSLFVSPLFHVWYLGKVPLPDCGISCVFSLFGRLFTI